jgi:hypothetical protein
MSNKIDLSNEDHCGQCGKYALGKVKPIYMNKTDDVVINNYCKQI